MGRGEETLGVHQRAVQGDQLEYVAAAGRFGEADEICDGVRRVVGDGRTRPRAVSGPWNELQVVHHVVRGAALACDRGAPGRELRSQPGGGKAARPFAAVAHGSQRV